MSRLAKDPCIVSKLTSQLQMNRFTIIATEKTFPIAKNIMKCGKDCKGMSDSCHKDTGGELQVIKKNENDLRNLIPFFETLKTSDTIVFCSPVCSSLLLYLIVLKKLVAPDYIWIAVGITVPLIDAGTFNNLIVMSSVPSYPPWNCISDKNEQCIVTRVTSVCR